MFEAEVQAGIKVLDEKNLDWRSAVLQASPYLDMAREDLCVLGHTMSHAMGYYTAKTLWNVDEDWMESHGFLITDETFTYNPDLDYTDAYLELGAAWKRAAAERPATPVG